MELKQPWAFSKYTYINTNILITGIFKAILSNTIRHLHEEFFTKEQWQSTQYTELHQQCNAIFKA